MRNRLVLASLIAAVLPARSVKELVAFVKSKPHQLNFASGGVGTGNHLIDERQAISAKG